jgi:hypothetical protein
MGAMETPARAYGEGRSRAGVSYGEVERAAIAILKSERRPTVETIREALGTGSPDTIALALKRFWRDLGARIEGDPAALTRMPADIAELADGMWQRALKLAGEAAAHHDNAARERLRQIEGEVDIRRRSFELREQEIDTQARERERALADARDHLLSLSKALSREQATNEAHARRITDLETQIAQYRQQMAELIAGAIAPIQSRPRLAAAKSTASRSRHRRSPPAAAKPTRQPRAKPKGAKKPKARSRHRSPPKASPRKKR